MGVIVTFNYAAWVARYPEFAAVSQDTATLYFGEASIYHANDGGGPVADPNVQSALLNMVTAHIAARYSQAQGSPVPGQPQDANTPVGRIASASEGSVSAQFENLYPPGSAQWWQQTKYGSDYWNATKPYRTMRYRASPGRQFYTGIYAGRSGGWPNA